MRRKDKEITDKNEIEDILSTAMVGRLGTCANGIPYIIDDMTPQGLDFISIFVDGKLMWLEDTYLEGHYLDLTFGVLCHTSVPASGL